MLCDGTLAVAKVVRSPTAVISCQPMWSENVGSANESRCRLLERMPSSQHVTRIVESPPAPGGNEIWLCSTVSASAPPSDLTERSRATVAHVVVAYAADSASETDPSWFVSIALRCWHVGISAMSIT